MALTLLLVIYRFIHPSLIHICYPSSIPIGQVHHLLFVHGARELQLGQSCINKNLVSDSDINALNCTHKMTSLQANTQV